MGLWLRQKQFSITGSWVLGLLIVANGLLLISAGSFFRVGGAMILLLLPGLAWAESLALGEERPGRWTVGLGLSYALVIIFGLLLHYLPGPIPPWMILVLLNSLVLSAVVALQFRRNNSVSLPTGFYLPKIYLLLLGILIIAAFFRFSVLGLSEFQGDETKPMFSAAQALAGDEDALFANRKKGPGEILIPMMLWPLTGTINEQIARTLFALAGVLSVLAAYLIANQLLGEMAGLIAAGLMALNGFMIGFSRIVQYQQMVIWMSLLASLCAWEWRKSEQIRWAALMGLFLGVGVLFHYDTLVLVPALIYLIVSKPKFGGSDFRSVAIAVIIMLAVVILFIAPFAENPQAAFTANYVEGRIGQTLITNNLFNFFRYTIFYNSFYYVAITGLLLLGLLVDAVNSIKQLPAVVRYLALAIVVTTIVYLAVVPDAFYIPGLDLDLAFLPFALLFLGAFLSPLSTVGQKAIIIWLAVSFLGYNFIVSDPRTHYYTISPAWVMLAAVAAVWLWHKLASINHYLPFAIGFFLVLLFGGYLYFAFLRQDIEFWEDWPDSQPALYWTPYTAKPRHHFGFVHKYGWKAVGGLYASGLLEGRYATNSASGIDRWYGRQVLWGCKCCQPKKYYLAFDYKKIDRNEFADYQAIGKIILPLNGRSIAVYSSEPDPAKLEPIPAVELYQAFDRTAQPSAYIAPRGERQTVDVNLANLFKLVEYEIIAPTPYPGKEIAVILHWQRGQDFVPIDFDIFVQIEDADGNIWGQSMSSPVCGQRVTSGWGEDETISDSHIIVINSETPPGNYMISAGMYLPNENFRLPILDETGQPVAESVELAMVTIE